MLDDPGFMRFIVLWIFWGAIVGGVLASRAKGRYQNPWKWFFIGLASAALCGPFALIGWFFVPRDPRIEEFEEK